MSKIQWTEDQKKAIDTKGNILVSASAGSGKSTVLVERVMNLVADGVPIEKILILVFNNSAAAELREKLSKKILEKIGTADKEIRNLLCDSLDSLPFAQIGTLDSFCLNLVKQNFEELGVSPNANVADDTEMSMYFEKAINLIVDFYAKKEDKQFDVLVSMFAKKRNEEGLFDIVKKIFEIASVQPDFDKFLVDMQKNFETFDESEFFFIIADEIKNAYSKFARHATNFENDLRQDEQFKKADIVALCGDFSKRITKTKTFDDLAKCFGQELKLPNMPKTKPNNEYLSKQANDMKTAFTKRYKLDRAKFANIEKLEKGHKQNLENFVKLVEIVKLLKKNISKLMSKDEKFSFNDIEHLAVDLLSNEKNIEIKKQYDFVFVDEYQDINPMQEFIIGKVVGENNAFMVGDTKQSIYGFRMANPNIFLDRMKGYQTVGGSNIFLNKNYRSSENILAFVNNVFDVVMTEQSCGIDYEGNARFEIEKSKPTDDVEIHIFDSKKKKTEYVPNGLYQLSKHEKDIEIETGAVEEANFIFDKIQSLVGKAKIGNGENMRYARYGDFAILYRSKNSEVNTVVKTLLDKKLPLDGENLSAGETKAESELILIARTVQNPTDDINFAGFLLSNFVCFNENDLADIRIALEVGSMFEATKKRAEIDDELGLKIKNVLVELDELRLVASTKTVSEFFEYCIFKSGYFELLQAEGQEKFQKINSFVNSLKGKDCNENLYKFLTSYEFIKNQKEKSSAVASSNKVVLQTIHKSKGLEYPYVFLIGICKTFGTKSVNGDLITDNMQYVGMSYFEKKTRTKFETLSHMATKLSIVNRERKEEMRLFYVALTRPKNELCLCGVGKFGELEKIDYGEPKSYFDFVKIAFQNGDMSDSQTGYNLLPYYFEHPNRGNEIFVEEKFVPKFVECDEELKLEIEKLQNFEYEHKNSTGLLQKRSVTSFSASKFENANESVMFDDEQKNKGIAIHKVMENLDFECSSIDEVKKQIDKFVKNDLLDKEQADLVDVEKIVKCLKSKLFMQASNLTTDREKPFQMYVPLSMISDLDEEKNIEDKVLVQGVIDLIIYNGDEIIVVDYKNSKSGIAKLKEKYQKQINLYKFALQSSNPDKKIISYIYSFGSDTDFCMD